MVFKNKKKTMAVKLSKFYGKGIGISVSLLPCLDVWYNDRTLMFQLAWLSWCIEFWFGEVKNIN